MTKVVPGMAEEPSRYIVDRMRAIDRKEIFGLRDDHSTDRMVFDLLYVAGQPGLCFTCFAPDGEPVSVFGYHRMRAGVANVYAFGTDRWSEVVLSMTKTVRRVIVPSLETEGYHRAECAALTEREDTNNWLPMLGMKCEAVLAGFGSQREDYSLYVWRPGNVFRKRRK